MLKILIPTLMFSTSLYAETCNGILDCTKIYEKLTNEKIETKFLPANLSTLNEELVMDASNAKKSFNQYLSEAGITIRENGKENRFLYAARRGAGVTASIYRVTPEILEKIKNQNERVNLIYSVKGNAETLVDTSVRQQLSKGKDKTPNIIDFKDNKIVFISDIGKNAYLIVKALEARDK